MKTLKTIFLIWIIMITTINAQEKYTNKLINEDSPYLQQHAHNPVNWYPWGQEAFDKAKKENKLIFLSIGYSTCHWCHVMEHESFENESVAAILNKYFISIKVDREEMPHVDKYYQDVHNLLNKRAGGWPLTIILTPQRKPFFAATYIPREANYGRPGIKELLLKIEGIFDTNPKKIVESSIQIENILKNHKKDSSEKHVQLNSKFVDKFVSDVEDSFDKANHGIGSAPKFPHASTIDTLLDIYSIYKNKKALNMATNMLKGMLNGGIYDQIEGGFYRYSVDEKWMIPHFEKMLYTNAELLDAYAKAYLITKDEFYKTIVDEIIAFTKERFEKNSLLYSASDADSLGQSGKNEEGFYFVFEYSEVVDFLEKNGYSKKNIKEILAYFNITEQGNFEDDLNNPYLSGAKVPDNLEKVKKDLKRLRSQKKYPFVDHKILTSWNSMYISSLFEAGKIDKKYARQALTHLDALLDKLYVNDTLYHQRLIGKTPKVKALFEDYAFLIDSLLNAYDFSLNHKYLELAIKLNSEATSKFYKNENWYMSNDEFEAITPVYDSSYKSPLSVMIDDNLKLALLTEDLGLQDIAKKSIESNSLTLSSNPSNTAWLLRSFVAYEKGYIVLEAPKNKLENKVLPDYPFILRKVIKGDQYLACKVDVCFAFGKDFNEIVGKILKNIE
jgi:uncharacterized protein YyaL (SSP411 family)